MRQWLLKYEFWCNNLPATSHREATRCGRLAGDDWPNGLRVQNMGGVLRFRCSQYSPDEAGCRTHAHVLNLESRRQLCRLPGQNEHASARSSTSSARPYAVLAHWLSSLSRPLAASTAIPFGGTQSSNLRHRDCRGSPKAGNDRNQ